MDQTKTAKEPVQAKAYQVHYQIDPFTWKKISSRELWRQGWLKRALLLRAGVAGLFFLLAFWLLLESILHPGPQRWNAFYVSPFVMMLLSTAAGCASAAGGLFLLLRARRTDQLYYEGRQEMKQETTLQFYNDWFDQKNSACQLCMPWTAVNGFVRTSQAYIIDIGSQPQYYGILIPRISIQEKQSEALDNIFSALARQYRKPYRRSNR